MMKTAFVFAGQGSQHVGMGADLYEAYEPYRQAFDAMDPDGSIKALCFEGPEDELQQTRNTQPAMVAFAVATCELLKSAGIEPDMVAGLSIGEYPALAAAGVFTPKQAVEVAAFRGAAMEDAVAGRASGMVAVMGLEREPLAAICEQASELGVVEPTNFNCPGQIVISGDAAAVERAVELAGEAGGKCIPLKVSGPFHTSLMAPAAKKLHEYFAGIEFGEMKVPMVFGTTGKTLADGETIAGNLEQQVMSSIYFEDIVRFMKDAGIERIVEIGPNATLAKLIRKTDKSLEVASVFDVASYEKTLAKLQA